MANKIWEHLKLENGDTVQFAPPTPNGEFLGGISLEEKNKINNAEAMIAEPYNPTKPEGYAIGEYCIKDGGLYRCKTAIAAGGEEWNSEHWMNITIGDEINQLSSSIVDIMGNGSVDISSIENYMDTEAEGLPNSTGSWTFSLSTTPRKHIVIPIPYDGCTLRMVGNSSRTSYYAFVKSYLAPGTASDPVDYVAGESRRTLSSKQDSGDILIPDGTKYIILTTQSGGNSKPASFSITRDGGGIVSIIEKSVKAVDKKIDNLSESMKAVTIDSLSSYPASNGLIALDKTSGFININTSYKHKVVPVPQNAILEIEANTTTNLYIAGVKNYTVPISTGDAIEYSSYKYWTSRIEISKGTNYRSIVPPDVNYIIIQTYYKADATPVKFILTSEEKIKWIAMGDSITEGYYSISGEGMNDVESHLDGTSTYVAWIKRLTGFNTTNKGVGGCGWVKRGTSQYPKPNIREQIDATDEDGNYTIDFTQYDLLTVMLGVNDWKGNMNLGSFSDGINPAQESVYGNMRYFVETVLERNPRIKIILITPINCAKQNDAGNPITTIDNNWGIGYTGFNYTLEDIYEAIKEVSEYYGIEMIDMLHFSCVNRQNVRKMCPDRVHPSLDAHMQIGRELAKKINFM